MKERIVVSFEALSFGEMSTMAKCIKSGTFALSTEDSAPGIVPDGIYDALGTDKFYKDVLLDETAFFKCIFFSFTSNTDRIKIPIVLFGVSLKNKVHFPILIGKIIGMLITFDREKLSQLLKFKTESHETNSWKELGYVKKDIMEKVFSFYEKYSGEYQAIMAWEIRSEKSHTRKIAEANSFKRIEMPSFNKEVYYNKPLNEQDLKYIMECIERWMTLEPPKPQEDLKIKFVTMATLFLKILVEPKLTDEKIT